MSEDRKPASQPDHGPAWAVNDGNTVSADAAPASPMIVGGRYCIVRPIEEGGSSKVYEARESSTGRRCALKLLSKLGSDPNVLRRVAIEARATAHVESDHIVQVFDTGVDASLRIPYIAMELLRGEDMKKLLARVGRIEPGIAVRLALQAATGLARAHGRGIVHRDVKPANLFLTERDTGDVCVKVLDFGIAKVKAACDLELTDAISTHGAWLGTPRYMSPEQLGRSENVDARTDVWSLGIVLYEMLSGKQPFAHAHSLVELARAVLVAAPEDLRVVAPWVSADLADIVRTALNHDPNRRFADCEAFRSALSRLADDDRVRRDALARAAPVAVAARDDSVRSRRFPGFTRAGLGRAVPWLIAAPVSIGLAVTLLFPRASAQRERDRDHAAPSAEKTTFTTPRAVSPPAASAEIRAPHAASTVPEAAGVSSSRAAASPERPPSARPPSTALPRATAAGARPSPPAPSSSSPSASDTLRNSVDEFK